MTDYLEIIEREKIVLTPVLNNDGSLDSWYAAYRYVHKITGQNVDYAEAYDPMVFCSGQTPQEALKKLLKYKRKNPAF